MHRGAARSPACRPYRPHNPPVTLVDASTLINLKSGRQRKENAVYSASPIPTFPTRFRNNEILTIEYRTTAEGIARFLPEQLTPRSDRVLIHIYRLHDPEWFGSYGELAVHIPVRHERSGVE